MQSESPVPNSFYNSEQTMEYGASAILKWIGLSIVIITYCWAAQPLFCVSEAQRQIYCMEPNQNCDDARWNWNEPMSSLPRNSPFVAARRLQQTTLKIKFWSDLDRGNLFLQACRLVVFRLVLDWRVDWWIGFYLVCGISVVVLQTAKNKNMKVELDQQI